MRFPLWHKDVKVLLSRVPNSRCQHTEEDIFFLQRTPRSLWLIESNINYIVIVVVEV